MKKMILDLLRQHSGNCGDIRGCDGEYLSDQVTNIIDLVKRLPSDEEMVRLREDSNKLSWTENPDRMGG